MKISNEENSEEKITVVEVVESGDVSHINGIRCEIDSNIKFDTHSLATYFFSGWEPVLYDSLLIAAAIEFCDHTQQRPIQKWRRNFIVQIPVHEPERWKQSDLYQSLHELLNFLTGDNWKITFTSRKKTVERPYQLSLNLGGDKSAVIPYSDGLDSHIVARIIEHELGSGLVRIRLKQSASVQNDKKNGFPYLSVPFKVLRGEKQFREASERSRGFKFALISGIVAYLSHANQVIIPESGQGIIGLVLVPVGQIYEDYRSNPLFTNKMENFLFSLLNYRVSYVFPQIWKTKGETLKEYIELTSGGDSGWAYTKSCWQSNWQIPVNHKARQCGICAACMLRRLSVHAAGLEEPETNYVWENLKATSFEAGASKMFDGKKITNAMKQYAIAGALHLEQIADLYNKFDNNPIIELRSFQLSKLFNESADVISMRIKRLLLQHKSEWENYMDFLGPDSFIVKWSRKVSHESA